ncbi:MAG: flagellar filament capping protein FliD [Lachnospiraceae bacterium]|nr:flagellar filament capping protein FliD [Lachnospiraceae bacterium]
MPIRLSGLSSGLDTDAVVKELMTAQRAKVDKITKKKTKLEWKKEAWTDLNKKVYSFYSEQAFKFKSSGTYKQKKATSTDESKITVKAGVDATTGSHTISVKQLASASYLTGGRIVDSTSQTTTTNNMTNTTKLSDLGITEDVTFSFSTSDGKTSSVTLNGDSAISDLTEKLGEVDMAVNVSDGKLSFVKTRTGASTGGTDVNNDDNYDVTISVDKQVAFEKLGLGSSTSLTIASGTHQSDAGAQVTYDTVSAGGGVTADTRLSDMGIAAGTVFNLNGTEIATTGTMTIRQLTDKFKEVGINASFDSKQQRFFLSSKESGTANDIQLTSDTAGVLAKLGLDTSVTNADPTQNAVKIDGKDATIIYNGATITSSTNDISVNGLNITVNDVTTDETGKDTPIKLSVTNDVDAIYDSVKDFVKAYNTLVKELSDKYSAKAAKGYEPLTDDEKEEMSEKQIEQWETKIKDSLLRRDSTISSLTSTMRTALSSSVEIDGKSYSLVSLGIKTGLYTENGQLHIDGDKDDASVSNNEDKLRKMIEEDPDKVYQILTGVGNQLYDKLKDSMSSIKGLRSALTVYNDKEMDTQITSYTKKIAEMEEKLQDMEDRYYKKYAALETAMSKLNAQSSQLAGFFGTSA